MKIPRIPTGQTDHVIRPVVRTVEALQGVHEEGLGARQVVAVRRVHARREESLGDHRPVGACLALDERLIDRGPRLLPL